MPKQIKEFLFDQTTGEINTEYDDNSTEKFNLAAVNQAVSSQAAAIAAVEGRVGLNSEYFFGAPEYINGDLYFHIKNNTIIDNYLFIGVGQRIYIDYGVKLTFNAGCSCNGATFYGPGTVEIFGCTIDVSWFAGESVDKKWDFLRRGLTTNRAYKARFPRPPANDPAAIDVGAYGGWWWRADSPLIFGDPENLATIEFDCGIGTSIALPSIIQLGDVAGNLKTEGLKFPSGISLYGSDVAEIGLYIAGAGHVHLPSVDILGCVSPLVIESGNAGNLGVNDLTICKLYSARYSAAPVQIRGKNNVKTFDVRILTSSFDGALTSGVQNLVQVAGAVRGLSIGLESNPTTASGLFDVAGELIAVDSHATSLSGIEGFDIQYISNQYASGSKKYISIVKTNALAAVHRCVRVKSAYSRSAPTSVDAYTLDGVDDVHIVGSRTDKVTLGPTATNVTLVGFDRVNVSAASVMPSVNGSIQRMFSLANNVTSATAIPINIRSGAIVAVTSVSSGVIDSCLLSVRVDGDNLVSISSGSDAFSSTIGTPSKINFGVASGILNIQNMTGTTKSMLVQIIY